MDRETWAVRPQTADPGTWENRAGAASLAEGIEQTLGSDCVPDPQFFVDSWTLGVTAASEGFHARRPARSAPDGTASWRFGCFIPVFSAQDLASLFPGAASRESGRNPSARFAAHPLHDWSLPPDGEANAGARTAHGPAPGDTPPRPKTTGQPQNLEDARHLLGVGADSSRDQIKIAYRRMARLHHPDRVGSLSPADRAAATERMMRINEAYRLLRAHS